MVTNVPYQLDTATQSPAAADQGPDEPRPKP